MKRNKWIIALSILLCVFSLTGCAKIVKIGEEEALIGGNENAKLDVAAFWDKQAVPEIEETAVELAELLNDAGGDLAGQEDKGRVTNGASGSLNFAVHAEGEVVEVVNDIKAGYLTVKLDGYEGETAINVQVGPVFKKSSVRDYLSFINVNDYSDQIEFAQLSQNITAYIYENVIADTDIGSLTGKRIEFYGCFTCENNDKVLITPITFAVK